ncbi:MAG: hypothetical protein E6J41_28800 [Chloroflexi bacterium]|nr:MAG: hypothetical protein E6J41_28800 [Chloroflexota bacterium]
MTETMQRALTDDALASVTLHVVGQSRAFMHQVDGWLHEIGSLNDDRAAAVVGSMQQALTEPELQGTLCDLERRATELLQRLRAESGG